MKHAPLWMASIALLLAGCDAATNAANGVGAYAEKTAQNIGEKTTDTSITLAVKGALVDADTKLGQRVKVTTVQGVVTLHGVVGTPEDKARAEDIAHKAKGVVSVVNEIEIVPGP
jgi:hyperosmotically inducible periplasmic protein